MSDPKDNIPMLRLQFEMSWADSSYLLTHAVKKLFPEQTMDGAHFETIYLDANREMIKPQPHIVSVRWVVPQTLTADDLKVLD